MYDADGLRIHLLYGVVASLRESCIMLHLLFGTRHRPKEAVRRLIAHLHPFHIDTIILQQLEGFSRMLG